MELLEAVKSGDVEMTLKLIEKGADIGFTDNTLSTPLHYAAALNEPALIELLVKYGADINAVDKEKNTILHRAIIEGSVANVEAIIRIASTAGGGSGGGDENEGMKKEVASLKIDIKKTNKAGQTPLDLAISLGHNNIVNILQPYCNTPRELYGYKRVPSNTSIVSATISSTNSTSNLNAILNSSVASHFTASLTSSLSSFRSKSGDFDDGQSNKQGFFSGLGFGAKKTKNLGLPNGILASKNGDLEELMQLLNSGQCNINLKDENGCSIAYHAAENARVTCLALCIEKRADLTSPNNSGWTPLHAAACGATKEHEACAGMIIGTFEGQTKVNQLRAKTNNNETPVMIAERLNNNPSMVKLLRQATIQSSIQELRRFSNTPENEVISGSLTLVLDYLQQMQSELDEANKKTVALETRLIRSMNNNSVNLDGGNSNLKRNSLGPINENSESTYSNNELSLMTVNLNGNLNNNNLEQPLSPITPMAPNGLRSSTSNPNLNLLGSSASNLGSNLATPGSNVNCYDCMQFQIQLSKLKKDHEELSTKNKKLMGSMAKAAQEYEAKITGLEKDLKACEQEKNEAIEEKEKVVKRTEATFLNKISKITQETENVLKQIQQELADVDEEKRDLITFQKKNKHLTWIADELVEYCFNPLCSTKFSRNNRKHHCRCCGRVFCEKCSKERHSIVGLGFVNPVRVCEPCFKILSSSKSPFAKSTSN